MGQAPHPYTQLSSALPLFDVHFLASLNMRLMLRDLSTLIKQPPPPPPPPPSSFLVTRYLLQARLEQAEGKLLGWRAAVTECTDTPEECGPR